MSFEMRTKDGERPDICKPKDKKCLTCEHYHTYYECMSTREPEEPIWQCDVIHNHADSTNPGCTWKMKEKL